MVIGLVCNIDEEPVVVGIAIVEGDDGRLAHNEVFRHRASASDDWAQQLHLLAQHLDTTLRATDVETIVVRSVEAWRPGSQAREGPKRKRLQVEGVLLEVARRHASRVEALTGRDIGTACGLDKSAVEQRARALLGRRRDQIEAGSAALAALAIERRD